MTAPDDPVRLLVEAVKKLLGHCAECRLDSAKHAVDYVALRAALDNYDAYLSVARPDADEVYVDEHGTAWTRPTAWAYAQACKARDKHAAALQAERSRAKPSENARGVARDLVSAIIVHIECGDPNTVALDTAAAVLAAHAAAAAAEERWQSIDTAPRDGSRILVTCLWLGTKHVYIAHWGKFGWMENSTTLYPKHMQEFLEWQPLPGTP